MKKKIIVIGSGFGGLGVASRLLSAGHDVTIIEKRDKLGGRAYVYEKKGFKFDGGPTVITAPFMFDDIWEAAGKKRSDYVEFVPCDPFYRIFDHNGEKFDYNNDHEFTIKEIEKRSPGDVAGYEKFLATTKAIFQKGFVELADQPFLKFMDMMKVAPDLIKLQSYKTVYKYVSKFIKDDFLRQCFSFHPLLVGGNPFDTTSIYAMIHYLEREWGVHYAMGGTGAIVNAFEKLIAEQGGKFHLETEVDEILVKNGKAIGVRLKNGDILDADVIVANSDVGFTYKNMIDSKHRRKYTDKKIDRTKYSMSLFVIYFGTKKRYLDSGLAHHNIILGKRYKGLLDDIFHKKYVADDFSLYLHMPTITDSSIAPEGHEGFYVLSPVPHLDSGTDWNEFATKYRDAIMDFLEENYLPDLQKNIVAEHYIDPLHFKEVLNSHKGSAFSVEPILTQSAWFRPHNKSEDVEDLYFVGAGTHPGAGLPGVLSSSIIAQDLIGKA
ncbi:MAG TPA: phytoene desaturase [Balneola sp.]|jgi:phytoene desaturase|nr:phytoene dehydrogenase [Balneola sp.]MAO76435.1 phytoene dehydrogenase [Balneola sp.]MBF65626.1 phytoene dehydrogenase [Balneola sp.]HBZ40071.1 phytoene desaturase [Balneola sp.]|tara:strand:- start:119418 stop:120896 length:1479 start_codon:yes stop_codon:yes gene_type:complete